MKAAKPKPDLAQPIRPATGKEAIGAAVPRVEEIEAFMRRNLYREIELFRSMDKNRDGFVDHDEVRWGTLSILDAMCTLQMLSPTNILISFIL